MKKNEKYVRGQGKLEALARLCRMIIIGFVVSVGVIVLVGVCEISFPLFSVFSQPTNESKNTNAKTNTINLFIIVYLFCSFRRKISQ